MSQCPPGGHLDVLTRFTVYGNEKDDKRTQEVKPAFVPFDLTQSVFDLLINTRIKALYGAAPSPLRVSDVTNPM